MQSPLLLLASLGLTLSASGSLLAQEASETPPAATADAQGVAWGSWWVLGPFDHPEGSRTVEPEHKPERDFRKMKAGKEWEGLIEDEFRGKGKLDLRWTRLSGPAPATVDHGRIDCTAVVPPVPGMAGWSDNTVAYLYRAVRAPRALEVEIMFGSDDGVACWLNGERLMQRNAARGVNVRDERLRLRLEEGVNHLVFKINNGAGGWGFQMARYQRVEQERINGAIDRGVSWLLSRQLIDGSWGEEHVKYRNGATALAVYTLVKSGLPARHPAILEALAFLAEAPTTMTYSAGCHLMALAALQDEESLPWMEEILGDLLSWQDRQGVWGYPDGHADLSCTQYAALGLRAAAEAGLEIPERVWVDLANGVIDHQLKRERIDTPNALEESYGGKLSVAGFSYRAVNPKRATGSMTTAGVATLAICLEQLGDRCPGKLRSSAERQMEYGLNWMVANWSVSSNPGMGHWVHYYLYGLERVGAMLKTDVIGLREWYWDGAEYLIDSQTATGDNLGMWGDPYGRVESATCFALLFLERATQAAFTDPHGSSTKSVAKSDLKAAPLQLAVMSASPASMWLSRVPPEALQGRRVIEVEYHGRKPGEAWELLTVKAAPEEPLPRERYAGRHTFVEAGTYEVKAVAILEDDSELASGVVSVAIEQATEAGIASYPTDAAKNLLPSGQPAITASSGGNPHHVVDNKMVSRWVCAGNDPSPELTIDLKRPVTADRILFTHARTRPIEQKTNPRATKVRVWLDHDDPIDVDLDPGYRVKSVMRLPEARSLREIRIRVLEVTGGELGKAAVGFSEIELQGPRKRRGRR